MTITEDRPTVAKEVGNARKRKEDQRLITGRTRWTDNITLPGMLHLAMVRSPYAHANIAAINTDVAKAATGVITVVTGADIKDVQGVVANAWPITGDQKAPPHLPVAVERVACAGEIVAVVVARTPSEARDAAELVDVDYEQLPAVFDLKEAAADTILAHPDLGTNKSAFWQLDSAAQGSGGSVEEAIAKARTDGIVIEREYRQQRLIPAFMEPRSTVVDPTGEQMTVWTSTQVPHILRFLVAATTGMPESKVRVIAPDVGGGFGGKLQTTPEEFATIAVARRLGKPCKYTETRSESLLSGHHGRDQWQKLTPLGREGRHRHRPQGRAPGRHGRLRRPRRRRCAGARRLDVQLDLQVPRLPVQLPDRPDEQDLGRRIPWGRPAGGDVCHRAAHGRARGRGRHRPPGDPREELDHPRRSSRSRALPG